MFTKKFRFTALITSVIALGTIAGCTHQPNVLPTPTSPTTGTPTSDICFERDILPIFVSNCAKSGCHDAATRADGYILTSYATITAKGLKPGNANNSDLYEVLIETDLDKRMPLNPNPALSSAQIDIIKRWINSGAPNSSGCTPICDASVFTYSGAIVPIINTYCKGCHATAAPSAGLALDTYTGVKLIADNGSFLGTTKHLSGYAAMPQGGAKLGDCELSQIEKWIQAGAPNN